MMTRAFGYIPGNIGSVPAANHSTHKIWTVNFDDLPAIDVGEPEKWEQVILPGIRQGILGAVLASQDEMVERPNTFELYGADFLLGTNYTPILLEINMDPSMGFTTSVTADLCQRCLEDIIKVVLDRKDDPEADTGNFEILYKQDMGRKQQHNDTNLTVFGSKIIPKKRI